MYYELYNMPLNNSAMRYLRNEYREDESYLNYMLNNKGNIEREDLEKSA